MKITIQNQTIKVTSADILVAGTVNVYEVEFDFDAAWEGYTRMAVFEGRAGGRAESREAVIDGGRAVIPWETLLPNGYLRIGVYGVKDSQRLPTIYTERLPVQRGAEQAEPSAEPTPGVIEQILIQTAADRTAAAESADAAEQARQGAETARSGAEAAQQIAETARSGAETAKTAAEQAAGAAQQYAGNAAQSAAIAAESAETLSGTIADVAQLKRDVTSLKNEINGINAAIGTGVIG